MNDFLDTVFTGHLKYPQSKTRILIPFYCQLTPFGDSDRCRKLFTIVIPSHRLIPTLPYHRTMTPNHRYHVFRTPPNTATSSQAPILHTHKQLLLHYPLRTNLRTAWTNHKYLVSRLTLFLWSDPYSLNSRCFNWQECNFRVLMEIN